MAREAVEPVPSNNGIQTDPTDSTEHMKKSCGDRIRKGVAAFQDCNRRPWVIDINPHIPLRSMQGQEIAWRGRQAIWERRGFDSKRGM